MFKTSTTWGSFSMILNMSVSFFGKINRILALFALWIRYGQDPSRGERPSRTTGSVADLYQGTYGIMCDKSVHITGEDPNVVFLATGTNHNPHFYGNRIFMFPFLIFWP